jgi:hypothetical protein
MTKLKPLGPIQPIITFGAANCLLKWILYAYLGYLLHTACYIQHAVLSHIIMALHFMVNGQFIIISLQTNATRIYN